MEDVKADSFCFGAAISGHELYMLEVNQFAKGTIVKWSRFVSRLRSRALWHVHGMLLWLLQRPALRYVPFPYPSVGTVSQWKMQAEQMVSLRCLPQRHVDRALRHGSFTMKNLADATWLRNRLGIKHSFMENPLLEGMLAARASKGLASKMKREAMAEAQKQADLEIAEGKQEEAARALLGPRGGLPSLRADLLRLAALLRVPIPEKATVEQIKQACRPMVGALMTKTSNKATCSTPTTAVAKETNLAPPIKPGKECEADSPASSAYSVVTSSMGVNRDDLEKMMLQQDPSHGSSDVYDKPASRSSTSLARYGGGRRQWESGHREIMEVMHQEWNGRFQDFMNETFVSAVDFPKTFVTEVYTTTKPILREAARRGHRVGSALSLETGWALDRRAARKLIDQEKPYFLAIAFPCGPWSPLMRLNPAADLAQKQAEGLVLIRFAIQLAKDQLLAGRHYLLENPLTSKAWTLPEMVKFLEEKEAELADFHQCRFGLKNDKGEPHRKATRVATSSPQVREQLHARRCLRDHQHAPVLGGAKVTVPAGHYPAPLARAMVKGMEEQFEVDFKAYPHEALAVDGEVEEEEQPEVPALTNYGSDSEEEEIKVENPKVPAGIVQAVRRLHENTGHRSNRRLARALIISGAPAEAVLAAKHLKCAICDEQKRPKVQRPASLPVPKDISDQVHLDIFEAEDALGRHHYVIHAVDFASRFQMAEVIAHKSSEAVVKWFTSRWQPIFGPPRVIVADQGREFVSYTFEEMCARSSTLLWHAAVQAPWQNGVCERAGGVLKGLLHALVKAHSIVNAEDLNVALQEAVTAYNNDINEMGVSPCQAALGRQPRMIGDTLGDFGQRLAEHGLIDDGLRPSLMRQMALRETAKVAMTRLHFSRGLRRAELARSRSTTTTHAQALEPGMIVYFYRQTKYNNKTSPSKKRLSLRRWHGPALLVAKEGHTSAFVSFKGQLTKCAVEHLRPATTLEQISAETWRDAIEEPSNMESNSQMADLKHYNLKLRLSLWKGNPRKELVKYRPRVRRPELEIYGIPVAFLDPLMDLQVICLLFFKAVDSDDFETVDPFGGFQKDEYGN
ncbi:unnamed protein product [Effrenium voratum]|uniref:Integrase catalytic domain-containing protein n=1 Tax=Effrenium voratum TaxID=2562239 RepID=A0AA36MLI8_9DINO|nr:unnamed protein product [Effrenium voratum]